MGHEQHAKIQQQVPQLSKEHAVTRGAVVVCLQVLQRPLLGRLKWLLVGK